MKTYEDGIYCSPDMIEKSGSFQNTSSSRNLGECCSLQTAPQQPVAAASESYSELEEILSDTPEPSTPPVQSSASGPLLTPGATKITEEASYGTTEDMGAVVDKLQA